MSIHRWLKKENVTRLPYPNKEQSMEMKSVVGAANDAQSVVSQKRGNYASYRQKWKTDRLMKSTGKSAKLKCSVFSI